MSAIERDLTARLRAAANYLDTHGWIQGSEEDEQGRVCLTGAVRLCAPEVGDEHLIRAVLRDRGRAEGWNDAASRTGEEVSAYLRTAEITDADLAATFGPQWRAMVAPVRRAAALTGEEIDRLAASRAASRDASWDASRDASRVASRAASWAASWAASRDASRAASRAAAGLHARDLIGQHGFTAEHYRILTGPWAQVIGPVHPDDERDGLYVAPGSAVTS